MVNNEPSDLPKKLGYDLFNNKLDNPNSLPIEFGYFPIFFI